MSSPSRYGCCSDRKPGQTVHAEGKPRTEGRERLDRALRGEVVPVAVPGTWDSMKDIDDRSSARRCRSCGANGTPLKIVQRFSSIPGTNAGLRGPKGYLVIHVGTALAVARMTAGYQTISGVLSFGPEQLLTKVASISYQYHTTLRPL